MRQKRAHARRRRVLAGAGPLALAAGAGAAACGMAATQTASAPAQLAPARLTVYIGGTQETYDLLTGRQFAAFASIHPGVSVDFNPGNLPLEKLRTLAAAGSTWELIKFLLEPEQLLPYCESRYFQPPRKSIANQGFMKQPLLQRMVEVFDKFGQAQIRVPDQAIFQKVTQDMAAAVYSGKAAPKQAVEDAARQLQNEVDKTGVKWTTL